jgi:ABC-2 type transport system permease protein
MLIKIIQHEWRSMVADKTAWVVIILFAVMTAVAVLNVAATLHRQQQAEQQNIKSEAEKFARYQREAAEIENQAALRGEAPPQFNPDMVKAPSAEYGPRDSIYVGAWRSLKIVPPPSQFMTLATGQSDLYPSSYKMGLEGRLEWQARGRVVQQVENPLLLMASRFDLAFVVLYLYPLLILALSFNMIAGEKENRTLALLLAQPISLRTLVLGKVILRALFACGCMIIFALLSLTLSGMNIGENGALARIMLWILAVVAYGGFWFGLAIAVNALGRGSAATALMLAAAWLLFLFIIPSTINFAIATLYPVPPRIAYVNQVNAEENRARQMRKQLVAQYLQEHPDLTSYSWSVDNLGIGYPYVPEAMPMHIEGIEIQKRLQPIIAQYEGQLAHQQKLVKATQFLSPAILMQNLLYNLAGTGRARYEYFLAQVNDFSAKWLNFFRSKLFYRQMVNAEEYDHIPRFSYKEESLGAVVRRIITPLAALIGLSLVTCYFGSRAYKRYPVAD